jgi:hypothetical protein
MAKIPGKAAPKLHATRTAPSKLTGSGSDDHDEQMMDEADDESFPASDPPASINPGSTLAVKRVAESGRATPEPQPDPGKRNVKPTRR